MHNHAYPTNGVSLVGVAPANAAAGEKRHAGESIDESIGVTGYRQLALGVITAQYIR
jgi:hypothetical protein